VEGKLRKKKRVCGDEALLGYYGGERRNKEGARQEDSDGLGSGEECEE
jgi:hypothetical protein